MAHRIFMGFEALDKYSQELLRKHAKKQQRSPMQIIRSLNVPLAFDVESDEEADITLEKVNITGAEGDITQTSPRPGTLKSGVCLQKPLIDTSNKRVLIPRKDSGSTKCQHHVPPETGSKTRVRSACTSATRRRAWRSEVECIPNLATLCQEEYKPPITPPLGQRDIPPRSSRASPRLYAGCPAGSGTMDFPTPRNKATDYKDADLTPEQQPSRNDNLQKKNTNKSKVKDVVSLSMEDEIRNPNTKILTPRCQTPAQRQIVSETVPVIFNHKSDLYETRNRYRTTDTGSAEQACDPRASVGVKPPEQSSLSRVQSSAKYRQTPPKATSEKKKKRLISANPNVNIRFLLADGTTQKPENKDGKPEATRNLSSKYVAQEVQPLAKSVVIQERVHSGDVGPVIIGMNPRKRSDAEPSSCPVRAPASRPTHPCASKAGSQRQRPLSNGETAKWSFISISKPLTPPARTPKTPSRQETAVLSSPAVTEERPASSKKGEHFHPPFESKRERFVSESEDINPRQGADEGQYVENEVNTDDISERTEPSELHDSPRPSPADDITRNPADKSIAANEKEDPEVFSEISTPPNASRVISIPTAQADSSE